MGDLNPEEWDLGTLVLTVEEQREEIDSTRAALRVVEAERDRFAGLLNAILEEEAKGSALSIAEFIEVGNGALFKALDDARAGLAGELAQ